MNLKTEVELQLNQLIAVGERICGSYQKDGSNFTVSYSSNESEISVRAFYTGALAAIGRIAGEKSDFYRSIPNIKPNTELSRHITNLSFIPAITGALIALRDAVLAGYLQSIEDRLTANVHDDMLNQAYVLLDSNYHIAAMVIAGGVLENHLRKLTTKVNTQFGGNGSLSKYNDLLKDSVYPQTVWRRIQAIADLRNRAAHGDVTTVAPSDVRDSLEYITRVTTDFP